MIKLSNVDNNVAFRCNIAGYQFPNSSHDDWCLLKVAIKQGDSYFETIDPAIEAQELVALYQWFENLAQKRLPRYAHLTFIEPCISFKFLAYKDNRVRISITLSHELKPDFDLEQFNSKQTSWSIVFSLEKDDFEGILNSLEAAIKLYPVRCEE